VPLLFVECRAGETEVLRRLHARASQPGQVSDANEAIYHAQAAEFMPLSEIPARNRIAIDSTRDPDTLGNEIQSALATVRASGGRGG
jgi:predicted kinase